MAEFNSILADFLKKTGLTLFYNIIGRFAIVDDTIMVKQPGFSMNNHLYVPIDPKWVQITPIERQGKILWKFDINDEAFNKEFMLNHPSFPSARNQIFKIKFVDPKDERGWFIVADAPEEIRDFYRDPSSRLLVDWYPPQNKDGTNFVLTLGARLDSMDFRTYTLFNKAVRYTQNYGFHNSGDFTSWLATHDQVDLIKEPSVILELNVKVLDDLLVILEKLNDKGFILKIVLKDIAEEEKFKARTEIHYTKEAFDKNQSGLKRLMNTLFAKNIALQPGKPNSLFPTKDVALNIEMGHDRFPLIKSSKYRNNPIGIFISPGELAHHMSLSPSAKALVDVLGNAVEPLFITDMAETWYRGFRFTGVTYSFK